MWKGCYIGILKTQVTGTLPVVVRSPSMCSQTSFLVSAKCLEKVGSTRWSCVQQGFLLAMEIRFLKMLFWGKVPPQHKNLLCITEGEPFCGWRCLPWWPFCGCIHHAVSEFWCCPHTQKDWGFLVGSSRQPKLFAYVSSLTEGFISHV